MRLRHISDCRKEILKLDESCISNPKSEISDWTAVQLEISDFGFEMQDSSNFKISFLQSDICRRRIFHPITSVPHAAVDQHKELPERLVLLLQYTDFLVVAPGEWPDLSSLQPHENIGFGQRHTERGAINNDLLWLNPGCPRNAHLGGLARFQVMVESTHDLLPPLLPDIDGQNIAGAIQLPRFETIQKMRDRHVSRVEFPQRPDQCFV